MLTNILKLSDNRIIYQYRGKSSNIYIIKEKNLNSTFLVDCGMPSDAKRLSEVLHSLPPLKRIVCTHFHVDHVSGWIKLRKIYRNCKIWLHEAAIPFVLGHKRIPSPTFKDIITVLIPCMREYGYFPTLVDLMETGFYTRPFHKFFCKSRLEFFQNTEPVLPGFETLLTPGHSPDCFSIRPWSTCSFLLRSYTMTASGTRSKANPWSAAGWTNLPGGTCLILTPGNPEATPPLTYHGTIAIIFSITQ